MENDYGGDNSQIAGCKKPDDKLKLCMGCARNKESSTYENFKPTEKEPGVITWFCKGFINKNNPSLF